MGGIQNSYVTVMFLLSRYPGTFFKDTCQSRILTKSPRKIAIRSFNNSRHSFELPSDFEQYLGFVVGEFFKAWT